MKTQNPSLRIAAADDRQQADVPRGWKYRLAAPVLFAVAGATLGTLTGLAVAILASPTGGHGLSIVLASTGSTGSNSDAVFTPVRQARSTTTNQAKGSGQSATEVDHLATNEAAAVTPKINRTAIVERSIPSRSVADAVSGDRRIRTKSSVSRKRRSVMRASRAHKKLASIALSSASLAGPLPMIVADGQLNLGDEAAPSNVYIEGDLTVADYDAKTGTIETSDGRTFLVGITVAASNATPWGEYRSDLHYRCSRTGSCALSRAGVIAPNARLI